MINEKLSNLIASAYNSVEHYRLLFDNLGIKPSIIKRREDLYRIPILTKDNIQKAPEKLLSSEYAFYPKSEELVLQRTSGSSGRVLKVYWSKNDFTNSMCNLWKIRNGVYGIEPKSKYCCFHSTLHLGNSVLEKIPDTIFSDNGLNLSFSKFRLSEEYIDKYYKMMLDFEPIWLFIQPSIALLFAKYIDENNLIVPTSLRYIELAGEYLFEETKNAIKKAFKVQTANMYGSMETNGIAIECQKGNLHCLEQNVVIEILNDDKILNEGEEGNIHVTSLTNRAMPLIRYALGDRGVLYPSKICGCGNNNQVLKVLAGRVYEDIIVDGREPVNSYLLFYPIERINTRFGYPIVQFQVIQNNITEFNVKLVLEKSFYGWKDAISNHFIKEVSKLELGNVTWNLTYSNDILPCPVSGKLQFFANNIGK